MGEMFLSCPRKQPQFTSVYSLQTRISVKHTYWPNGIMYRAPEVEIFAKSFLDESEDPISQQQRGKLFLITRHILDTVMIVTEIN